MIIPRRKFLKISALVAGAVLLPSPFRWFGRGNALAFYQGPAIPLFKTALRGAGPGGIPVALPDPVKAPLTGVTHYTLDIGEFQDQILPAGFPKTTLWGYNPTIGLGGNITPTHLGGIIIGQKGQPIQLTFRNNLPGRHILPVDTTIPGAEPGEPVNRAAVHLHGGLVPWISDGGPFDWFGPDGSHGSSFLNNDVLNPNAPAGSAEYYYPLTQSARFMWYHDHAMGITRLNAYSGIASALLLRDRFEAGLINKGLPNYIEAGGNEIPLVFQDKIFVGEDILESDPTWTGLTDPGSLWYAHTYDPDRWDIEAGGLPLPDPSAIPEFFADTMLVNGTVFPQATVEARRYRLRLLNATNARFLNLQLYVDDGSANGITLKSDGTPSNTPFVNAATRDATFLQIGTEGGFLAHPVEVPSNVPLVVPPPDANGSIDPTLFQKSLLLAPAERPDLIVDFSNYANQNIILYNDAAAPFPMGDSVNDYFPGLNNGNPANTGHDGFGPNSRVLMRFKVVPATSSDPPLRINTKTNLSKGLDPFLINPHILEQGVPAPKGFHRRFLSLNEYHDAYGRLIQILGNDAAPFGSPYDGSAKYLAYGPTEVTITKEATQEVVNDKDTEVWEIYNNTGDVHPMHFHLVNVQVINRQLVDTTSYPYQTTGPVIPPAPNEVGWKETVPMYPGTVTRVIMRFLVPQIKTAHGKRITTPESPRTGGSEYVWHCHILEHEEHDMMHALVVKPRDNH